MIASDSIRRAKNERTKSRNARRKELFASEKFQKGKISRKDIMQLRVE